MTALLNSEKQIAEFYQDHPYLIAKSLGDKTSFSERVIGRHRLDLLFALTNGSHSIVEFKRVPLEPDDLQQVVRYWKVWGKTHKMAAKHYLVGLRPKNTAAFERAKDKIVGFKIMVRIIPDDVACFVRWCEEARRYVRYKEGDQGERLELFFLSKK